MGRPPEVFVRPVTMTEEQRLQQIGRGHARCGPGGGHGVAWHSDLAWLSVLYSAQWTERLPLAVRPDDRQWCCTPGPSLLLSRLPGPAEAPDGVLWAGAPKTGWNALTGR
jgi:hypothetical protein